MYVSSTMACCDIIIEIHVIYQILWFCRLKVKATALKDPTAADTLANLIPASKAEEALVKKAGSKVSFLFFFVFFFFL